MDPLFIIIDLFCGFGGTTTGFTNAMYVAPDGNLYNAARVIACINHDPKAIKSHWMNHPEVKHFEEDIRTLDLTELIALANYYRAKYPAAKVILWASLECTNFSKAKGGKPRDADSRTLADHLHRYILALDPDYVKIENVVEFMSWGPMNKNGKPISKKNGEYWLNWRKRINGYGYYDEWKEMNSANYGAFTSRNRLFGIFAKDGLPIVWPQATHAKNPSKFSMHGDLKKWKAVKEVLIFEDEGQSIFNRKKPLSDKTLERIYAGLIKYVAKGDTSFISKYYSGKPASKNISVDGPAGTITTIDGQALVSIHPARENHEPGCCCEYNPSTDDYKEVVLASECCPVHNYNPIECRCKVPCKESFLLKYNSTNGKTCRHIPPSVDDPAPVISCQDRLGLVQATFIVQRNSGNQGTSAQKLTKDEQRTKRPGLARQPA